MPAPPLGLGSRRDALSTRIGMPLDHRRGPMVGSLLQLFTLVNFQIFCPTYHSEILLVPKDFSSPLKINKELG